MDSSHESLSVAHHLFSPLLQSWLLFVSCGPKKEEQTLCKIKEKLIYRGGIAQECVTTESMTPLYPLKLCLQRV